MGIGRGGVGVGSGSGVGGACEDQSSVPRLSAAVKKRFEPTAVGLYGYWERLPRSVVPAAVPSLSHNSGPFGEDAFVPMMNKVLSDAMSWLLDV